MADPVVATPPVAEAPKPAAPAAPQPAATPPAPSLLAPEPVKEAPKVEAVKEPPKPVDIKLTLPKDSLLTQAQVDKIASIAKERGLSQEQAVAWMETQQAQVKEFADANVKAWRDRQAAWETELKGNAEFGGDKLKEWGEGSYEVANKYGGAEFLKLLQESGYSKHPAVAKFLWNVYKAGRPDKIVQPHAPSMQTVKDDLADRLFPTTARKAQ